EPADSAPPMRTAGIVTATLAVVLVGAVWAWPRPSDVPPLDPPVRNQPTRTKPATPAPAVRSAPAEAATVTKESPAPAPARSEPAIQAADIEPATVPPKPVQFARAEPIRSLADRASRPEAPRPPDGALITESEVKTVHPAPAEKPAEAGKGSRVAALDRMSAGFFSQSMVHATSAKKEQLLAARDRSAAQRKTCRSDSCVADAYLREIRETSAIMEGRAGPK
ncbi:MAG: hypothetical protein ACJ8EZ_05300, partial [Sphingomicrobium sp.]